MDVGSESSTWLEPLPVGEMYTVHVGVGILKEVPSKIVELVPSSNYVILTDENLARLHVDRLVHAFKAALSGSERRVHLHVVPAGESSKCRAIKSRIEDWMLQQHCARDTCVVAFGGGVVGDLSGFVAATYMRGVPLVHIPTSTLAMCDSSIGGKTGIDTPAGKNLVGAFHRPRAVFMDMALLRTLPRRELCNGMAEAIKAGAIASEPLFAYIESNTDALLAMDLLCWAEVIRGSAGIKADVVVKDEFEGGLRSILNFGHSVGHAIEAICQPDLLHGECVSIGMMQEALLARSLGHLSSSAIRRLDQCVRAFDLPTLVPPQLRVEDLLLRMAVDKKNAGGKKKLVILTGIGSVLGPPYTTAVSDQLLSRLLCPTASVLPGRAEGSLAVPGSKSVSNRVLLITAMGEGTCRVRGLLHSEDTQVMLDSLRQLGVKFEWEDNARVLVMHGCGGKLEAAQEGDKERSLYLGNAGTASRFLTTLCNIIPTGSLTLGGNAYLHKRPVADLVDALRTNGCNIEYLQADGCLPIRITGAGGLPGGEIKLGANVSSQYVSSVLLSAAFAQAPVTLRLDRNKGRVVSAPYIKMTIALMQQFGVQVTETEPFTYQIPQGCYKNPEHFLVEGDASSSTYPLALAAITGGKVTVDNVGSESLQGDAHFHELLEKMGCTVSQTATSTTVEGPSHEAGLTAVEVDMDTMTDSFMTVCAVAAIAKGTTKITNIANQRVKECNRIEAMVSELRKVGVTASELPTGIQVEGLGGDIGALRPGTIDCRHDHRIAMSFAVLGARAPGIVADSKRCVDKTYPEFWDDIQGKLGLTLDDASALAAFVPQKDSEAASGIIAPSNTHPAVIIVGMRGAGKSTLGAKAASALGLPFHDVDECVEKEAGCSIKDLIAKSSWEAFRALELQVFLELSRNHPHDCIISCGGGIVETPAALEALKQLPCVVQVVRHIEDIERYLAADPTRPAYNAEVREVYERRRPLFQEAASHDFVMRKSESDWVKVEEEWIRFLEQITGLSPRGTVAPGTFFLSLTYPNVAEALAELPTISQGVDALELRVDLLADHSPSAVCGAVSAIRRASKLPIIFTVRSKDQGGRFLGDEDAFFALLRLGLRLGCEYIDVETHWSPPALARLNALITARYSSTVVIGSHHVPGGNGGNSEQLARLFDQCSMNGQADVIKVVVSATSPQDAIRLLHVAEDFSAQKPCIVLAMGEAGKLSRVYNQVLTPVTHPAMPFAAAPGQMSVADIQAARQVLGLTAPARKFFLFGHPISASPSPRMHNAGFQWCSLPHTYSLFETKDQDEFARTIRSASFGGASVTIPLKEQVATHLDGVGTAASAIGAVNTIVRDANGKLMGHNTDWIGICKPLRALLRTRDSHAVGVVVGAGGTARAALYALQQLGFQKETLVLVNPRTPAKAEKLAAEFDCTAATLCEPDGLQASLAGSEGTQMTPAVVVCTLPAVADFVLPATLISAHKPIVFDVCYGKETRLAKQAREAGCPVVTGATMLAAQGVAQFELWTGRRSAELTETMTKAASS